MCQVASEKMSYDEFFTLSDARSVVMCAAVHPCHEGIETESIKIVLSLSML